jgi:RNase P protein component
VARNRLRRRLRAIVQELAPTLAPGAYLVRATAEAVPASPAALRGWVAEALAAAPQEAAR